MQDGHRFWIEGLFDNEWRRVGASSNTASYCHGWLDCADGHYPSRPYRLCRLKAGAVWVLRQTKGRAAPHTN